MSARIAALSWALALGLVSGHASAQYSAVYRPTTPFGANYTSTLRSMQSLNAYNAIKRASSAQVANAATAATTSAATRPATSAAGPQFPVGRTDFRPGGERDTVRRLADSTALSAAAKVELLTFLRQAVAAIETQPGFRRNNLANALAAAIGISLQVLGERELPEQAIENMIRLLNDELVNSGTFARMTETDRTRAYDTFMVVGALVGSLSEKAKQTNDAPMAAQAREMAAETLRSFGFV